MCYNGHTQKTKEYQQDQPFLDEDVHTVLENSGYVPKIFMDTGKKSEWYPITLDVAIDAIKAVKEGKTIPMLF